ncbi:hypothetical protein C8R47DRAFT_1063166 [Mycena vitilis]|nr:hypothetical protein C8R47DRAFT_1063166 [Mycena vitilis]
MAVMLRTLAFGGTMAFIKAQYHVDYDAVRVQDVDGGSLFRFFDVDASALHHWPSNANEERRLYRPARNNILFGEVDYISDVTSCTFGGEPKRDMICIRVREPTGATCEGRRMYAEQLKRLRGILASDARDIGGVVAASWFDLSAVSPSWSEVPNCIYFIAHHTAGDRKTEAVLEFERGMNVFVMSRIERVDIVGGGRISRRYCVRLYNVAEIEVPLKRAGTSREDRALPRNAGYNSYVNLACNMVRHWVRLGKDSETAAAQECPDLDKHVTITYGVEFLRRVPLGSPAALARSAKRPHRTKTQTRLALAATMLEPAQIWSNWGKPVLNRSICDKYAINFPNYLNHVRLSILSSRPLSRPSPSIADTSSPPSMQKSLPDPLCITNPRCGTSRPADEALTAKCDLHRYRRAYGASSLPFPPGILLSNRCGGHASLVARTQITHTGWQRAQLARATDNASSVSSGSTNPSVRSKICPTPTAVSET